MEPIAEISVADSRFLGFCFEYSTEKEVKECQKALKEQYPKAAHVPIVYRFTSKGWFGKNEGYDEDGEPPESVGPGILKKIMKFGDKDCAVAIVRFWGETLLGVTCGRLPQCYQSIAELALHRHFSGKEKPLVKEMLNVKETDVYGMASGDCELILNVVPDPENNLADKVKSELNFEGFKGAAGEVLPRLQNLQANLSENLIPIYRYPGNYSGEEWETFEWSETSLEIKKAVEEKLLLPQTMNHCVTNYYRDGKDFIAHHSDKDLDLNRQGVIVSVSLGDERILELKRRSEPKDITRISLPSRSMLVLGPKTNKEFSHSILAKEYSNKLRISLTMRDVKTFKDLQSGRLFGQGVSSKSLHELRTRNLMENSMLCSLFAFLFLLANKITETTSFLGSFFLALILAAGTVSLRNLANMWYKQQEELEAREFFSKSSMSGTKY